MHLARVACLAPPLTDETLADYRALIDGVPEKSELRDILETLYSCVALWWEARESNLPSVEAIAGTGMTAGHRVRLQPLDDELKAEMWESIPWMDELRRFDAVLDTIDPIRERPLRDAAHHLQWHAKELCNDREPLTQDRILAAK